MKNPKKLKKIMAWAIIILLVALVIATLVFALIDTSWSYDAFKMCLGFTILLPVLLYIYLMIHRLLNRQNEDSQKGDQA